MSESIATPTIVITRDENDAESVNSYLPFPVVELRAVHHLQQNPPRLQVFQIFPAYKKNNIIQFKRN